MGIRDEGRGTLQLPRKISYLRIEILVKTSLLGHTNWIYRYATCFPSITSFIFHVNTSWNHNGMYSRKCLNKRMFDTNDLAKANLCSIRIPMTQNSSLGIQFTWKMRSLRTFNHSPTRGANIRITANWYKKQTNIYHLSMCIYTRTSCLPKTSQRLGIFLVNDFHVIEVKVGRARRIHAKYNTRQRPRFLMPKMCVNRWSNCQMASHPSLDIYWAMLWIVIYVIRRKFFKWAFLR